MKKIHKFMLCACHQWGLHSAWLPKGAKILHMDSIKREKSDIYLWAEIDTSQKLEKRKFVLYSTGEVLTDFPQKHMATLVLADGCCIIHIYELEGNLDESTTIPTR